MLNAPMVLLAMRHHVYNHFCWTWFPCLAFFVIVLPRFDGKLWGLREASCCASRVLSRRPESESEARWMFFFVNWTVSRIMMVLLASYTGCWFLLVGVQLLTRWPGTGRQGTESKAEWQIKQLRLSSNLHFSKKRQDPEAPRCKVCIADHCSGYPLRTLFRSLEVWHWTFKVDQLNIISRHILDQQ